MTGGHFYVSGVYIYSQREDTKTTNHPRSAGTQQAKASSAHLEVVGKSLRQGWPKSHTLIRSGAISKGNAAVLISSTLSMGIDLILPIILRLSFVDLWPSIPGSIGHTGSPFVCTPDSSGLATTPMELATVPFAFTRALPILDICLLVAVKALMLFV